MASRMGQVKDAAYAGGVDVAFDGPVSIFKHPGANLTGYWALEYSVSAGYPIVRSNSVDMPLNNGAVLLANGKGTVVFNMHTGASFSIRFSAACQINQCVLEFVDSDTR